LFQLHADVERQNTNVECTQVGRTFIALRLISTGKDDSFCAGALAGNLTEFLLVRVTIEQRTHDGKATVGSANTYKLESL
jgi:hypothetical protein